MRTYPATAAQGTHSFESSTPSVDAGNEGMLETTFSYRGHSVRLFAPQERDELSKWVRTSGTFYEYDVLERCELYIRQLGRSGETILDVGAYIGNHTVFFSFFCQPDQVIAFEPSTSSFEALTTTIRCNRLTNVTAYNLAIGDQDGWGAMTIFDPDNLGANRLEPTVSGDVSAVPIVPLDSFLEEFESRSMRISLIKIDVEGMESEVIGGSRQTIARHRPILCIEILDGQHMSRLNKLMKRFPYLIRECDGAAPTYLLTWESRIPRVFIRAINFLWLLLANYGNNAMRWWYRRVIEIMFPLRPSPAAS
jgi:protein O-GlcNAc transferase